MLHVGVQRHGSLDCGDVVTVIAGVDVAAVLRLVVGADAGPPVGLEVAKLAVIGHLKIKKK